MKNFYNIGLLLTVFIFLTTYTPSQIEFNSNKKNPYFNIQNILILNTNRIDLYTYNRYNNNIMTCYHHISRYVL